MAALPQIVLRPRKLYGPSAHDGHYRMVRGARRQDGDVGRTLALFDLLDIRKRGNSVAVYLSSEGHQELKARASAFRVHVAGLAAFLIESALRGMRGGKNTHCRRGHVLTPENTIHTKASGKRQCRECRRANDRFRKRRMRARAS